MTPGLSMHSCAESPDVTNAMDERADYGGIGRLAGPSSGVHKDKTTAEIALLPQESVRPIYAAVQLRDPEWREGFAAS